MADRRKVTIAQVAAAAGVSTATVSLVFNGKAKGQVAPATHERVLEAGERLGYRPGWISKVFRSGKAHVIGIVVGHSGTAIWELSYLPEYRGIIAGAAMEALEFGYSITVVPVRPEGGLSGPIRPDGIIVVDPAHGDPLIENALDDDIAVVSAGGHSRTIDSPRLGSVRYGVDGGVPAALAALVDAGASRPAFFRGPIVDEYTVESQRAYERWCEGRDVAPLVFVLDSGQTAIDAARMLLSGNQGAVDAVYCINESYASSITEAAAQLDITVPDKLVVAVAGGQRSGSVDPRLIYLDLDPIALGAQCAKLLVGILQGELPRDVTLPLTISRPRNMLP